MKPPILRPAAAADVEDAYRWYEAQRIGLGEEFLAAAGAVMELIQANPERFPVVHRQTRRALFRLFRTAFTTELLTIRLLLWHACMVGGTHDGGNLAHDG